MKTLSSLFFCLLFLSSQGQEIGNLLSRWSDSSASYNEVWGFVQNNAEYAVIGSNRGTHIIDVTDPSNIEEKFFIAGAGQSNGIVHRDYHEYKGYLYIVTGSINSSLKIVDLNPLPQNVPDLVYDTNDLIRRAHNIFIDTVTARMYALDVNTPEGSFPYCVYDISKPTTPALLASVNNIAGFNLYGVHDGHINNNLAFLNCGATGLIIADVTDPLDPYLIVNLPPSEYPQSGYNHSGWPTEDGNYYIFADENSGLDLKVLDIGALPWTSVTTTLEPYNLTLNPIPHNPVVHGNKLFCSYYTNGLQVYDLTNPAFPNLVMYYPTSSIGFGGFNGAWGVYPFLPSGNILVSDIQNGLFVIEDYGISAVEDQVKVGPIKIWPNPTSNQLINIENNSQKEIISLSVYSLQGTLVYDSSCKIKENQKFTLSLAQPTGKYLLKLHLAEGQEITKSILIIAP